MRSERCATVIRTSLGCCMRYAQSAAGESPPNPKVQHVHYDTGPRVTDNRRACGCCGALARKRPVFQISRGFCTQGALKKRDNDSPPPQRPWACRACVYSSTNAPTAAEWNICAGPGACTHIVPKRGPSPKQRAVGGWRICASAGAQSRQSKHSPGDPMTLNFGYHVRALLLARTTSQPSQGAPSALCVPRVSDFPRSHARIGITTVLSAHTTVALHQLHPTTHRT